MKERRHIFNNVGPASERSFEPRPVCYSTHALNCYFKPKIAYTPCLHPCNPRPESTSCFPNGIKTQYLNKMPLSTSVPTLRALMLAGGSWGDRCCRNIQNRCHEVIFCLLSIVTASSVWEQIEKVLASSSPSQRLQHGLAGFALIPTGSCSE